MHRPDYRTNFYTNQLSSHILRKIALMPISSPNRKTASRN